MQMNDQFISDLSIFNTEIENNLKLVAFTYMRIQKPVFGYNSIFHIHKYQIGSTNSCNQDFRKIIWIFGLFAHLCLAQLPWSLSRHKSCRADQSNDKRVYGYKAVKLNYLCLWTPLYAYNPRPMCALNCVGNVHKLCMRRWVCVFETCVTEKVDGFALWNCSRVTIKWPRK